MDLAERWTLEYPLIIGEVVRTSGTVKSEARPSRGPQAGPLLRAFDIETVQRVEVLQLDTGNTIGTVFAVVGGALLVAAIVAVATKSSCPFVYVDEGTGERLVGEGYPGALFRAVQREDLLPLPIRGEGAVTVRLVNWAPEVQYTDRLELAVVDHEVDRRAVATMDARVLLVGRSAGPLTATDFAGRDARELVRSADDVVWCTDLRRAAAEASPSSREGLDVTFLPSGGRSVLELRLKNSKWMEMVFSRVFSMMGSRFTRAMENANRDTKGEILRWRRREGVDLRVEARRDEAWETIGWIPATGAVAMREVAVPLPPDWPAGEPVRVRVSGGTGFWRVDSVALSTLIDERPTVVRLPASRAVGMDGSDQLATLSAVDHRYNELAAAGDWMEARFSFPPLSSGHVREVFLASNGYYTPRPPTHPDPSLRRLKRIRDEEGALARYGLEFFREIDESRPERVSAPR